MVICVKIKEIKIKGLMKMSDKNKEFQEGKVLRTNRVIEESESILERVKNGEEVSQSELVNALKFSNLLLVDQKKEIVETYKDKEELSNLSSQLGYFNLAKMGHHEINSRFSSLSRNLNSLIESSGGAGQMYKARLNEDIGRLSNMFINVCDLKQTSFGRDPSRYVKFLRELNRFRVEINLNGADEDSLRLNRETSYVLAELISNGLRHSSEKVAVEYRESDYLWIVSTTGDPLPEKMVKDMWRMGYKEDSSRGYGNGLALCRFLADTKRFYLEYDKDKVFGNKNTFLVSSRVKYSLEEQKTKL